MKTGFLVLALAGIPLMGRADAPDGRPVLNSFVNHRVTNVGQLMAQVSSDPVVADRYERHFSMNRRAVLDFLSGLHRGTLDKDGVYTIYSVPQGGRLKMHVGRIRKGEPMFLDAQGRPTLVVKCGNPVVLGPNRANAGNPVAMNAISSGPRDLEPVAEATPTEANLVTLEPETPVALAEVPASATMVDDGGQRAMVGAVGVVSSGANTLLPFLPLLPIIVGSSGGNPPHNNPVPEPASIAALGLGALGALKRRKR